MHKLNNRGGILSTLIVVVAVLSIFSVALSTVTLTQKKLANNEEINEQAKLSAMSSAEYLENNKDLIVNAYNTNNSNPIELYNNEDLGVVTYQVSKEGTTKLNVDVNAKHKASAYNVRLVYNVSTADGTFGTGISIKNEIELVGGTSSGKYNYNSTTGNFEKDGTNVEDLLDSYLQNSNGSQMDFGHYDTPPTITFPNANYKTMTSTKISNRDETISTTTRLEYTGNQGFQNTVTFDTGAGKTLTIYVPTSFNVRENGTAGKAKFEVKGTGTVNFYIYKDGTDNNFTFPTVERVGTSAMINMYANDAINLDIMYTRQNADRNTSTVFGNIIAPNATITFEGDDKNYKNGDNLDSPMITGNIICSKLVIDVTNHKEGNNNSNSINFFFNQGNVNLPPNYVGGKKITFGEYKK